MKKHISHSILFVLATVVAGTVVTFAQQKADDPANEFYKLTKAAPAAFVAGDHAKAEALARQLLAESESWKENWNYGNAIHAANLVLGRVALARGETAEARKFLVAAGRTPGSPQLNTFGPDMLFASEMLEKGERAVVVEYFDLCLKFWKKESRIAEWRAAIARNEAPDFGANVRYFFPSAVETAR